MKNPSAFLLLGCLLGTLANLAQAQKAERQPFVRDRGYWSANINPAYPFLGGFGAKGFYNLPHRWSFGLVAEGAFQLPGFAAEQFFANGDNLRVRWDYALGTEVRYRFNRRDNDIRGFYLMAGAGYEGWTVRAREGEAAQPSTAQSVSFTNWYASVGVGFNWLPLRNRGLWIGIAYQTIWLLNNTDSRSVNGTTFNLRPWVSPGLAPTLSVGWRFGRSSQ
jgi:hypothetical protein